MISIIVVIGKNKGIGYKNKLLWRLPRDMARFKKITKRGVVLMGDRTFKSIGTPLPDRKNIVVSLNKKFKAPGCELRFSLDEVLNEYKSKKEELFVIGGGQIYKQSIIKADKLYLTIIDEAPRADVFFPVYSKFNKIIKEETGEDNGYNYEFKILTREKSKSSN